MAIPWSRCTRSLSQRILKWRSLATTLILNYRTPHPQTAIPRSRLRYRSQLP
ncbi:MAG: hypothetical protein HEP80_14555 [Dolichospermum sp. UKL201]|nr:MAG: hypothetical protein HEP80_14555 [Dolichospermum sp. UKL201]